MSYITDARDSYETHRDAAVDLLDHIGHQGAAVDAARAAQALVHATLAAAAATIYAEPGNHCENCCAR